MAGRFVWWDLMTVDIEKSASFFASLLECDVLSPEDEPSYLMLAPSGTEEPLFGFVAIEPEEGTTSHWMGYIAVPDMGATLARIPELGGAIALQTDDLAEEDAGEVPMEFSIVTDAQGSVFALMPDNGASAASSPDEVPPIGRIAWVELLAQDRRAAAAFYHELLGWEVGPEHDRPDEGKAHALFEGGAEGRVFGLLRDQPLGSPMAPHWAYFIRVPDLDQAILRARELGGFIYEDPAAVDGGRRVILLDPTGAPVALWQVG